MLPCKSSQLANVGLASLASVALHPGLLSSWLNGYAQDSLYTLSPLEAAGLILLSMTLSLGLIFICMLKSCWLYSRFNTIPATGFNTTERSRNHDCATHTDHFALSLIALDVISSFVLSLIAVLTVPQLHYLYYQLIFDSLPSQWVIPGEFSLHRSIRWLLMPAGESIAEHANALIIWVCTLSALIAGWRYRRTGK